MCDACRDPEAEERLSKENMVRSFLGKPPKPNPVAQRRLAMIRADRPKMEPVIQQAADFVKAQSETATDFPVIAAYAQGLAKTLQDAQGSITMEVIRSGGNPFDAMSASEMETAKILYEAIILGMHIGDAWGMNLTEDKAAE
jgi:hypothetical protein